MTGPVAPDLAARPRDWDAATYDRVSDPQTSWGMEVLGRLYLHGDETVVDAGCGTGRITRALADRLPNGRVIAVDGSPSMAERARATLPAQVEVIVADLSELTLETPADAILSTAVFHWITDHDRLFRRLHACLRPGGRLVAQCGGRGNVAALREAIDGVSENQPFAEFLAGWAGPWNFASAQGAAAALARAGFVEVSCWLQPKPIRPPGVAGDFISSVSLGSHLDRLPPGLRDAFVEMVMSQMPDPITLDYVRLNISASRAP